ncbi:DoxX family membrane protein [Parapedobacter sp.]
MKNKIQFALRLLFGIGYVNSGLNKFFNYMPVPDDLPEALIRVFTAFMEIGWLMPLVAVIEIVGGLLFIPPKFKALGAIVIFPISVGVLLIHLTVAPAGLPMALFIMAINVWVIIDNRRKYLPMVHE